MFYNSHTCNNLDKVFIYCVIMMNIKTHQAIKSYEINAKAHKHNFKVHVSARHHCSD